MRLLISAAPFYLSLCLAGHAFGADTPAAADTSVSAGDAAAKHAKRTACLRQAKSQKLIGAERTAFIKRCMESP